MTPLLSPSPELQQRLSKLRPDAKGQLLGLIELDLSEMVEKRYAELTAPPNLPEDEFNRGAQYLIWRVAATWMITPTKMVSASRRAEFALPRAMAAKLGVDVCGLPVSVMAWALRRDRTTIYSLIDRHDVALERYEEYRINWEILSKEFPQKLESLNFDGIEPYEN